MTCFDGTGNQVRARDNTSVVRLFALLDLSEPASQVGYYDPGFGTMGSSRSWTPWGQSVTKVLGLGIGLGLRENLGGAYEFLMRHYEEGDRPYVFGFGRGALPRATARSSPVNTSGTIRSGIKLVRRIAT